MNTKFPTLYKFTKTGAIQEWTITAYDDYYECVYGQQGGAMQRAAKKVKRKNVGRANETSLPEQARLEAESKWKKQIDKGYSEGAPVNMDDIKPMLAHSKAWEPGDKRVKYPLLMQPKLDGMRCIAKKEKGVVTLYSRKTKVIDTLPHIDEELNKILDEGDIVDGELYIHGVAFQTLMSWIKRHQPDSFQIQYHIYDMVSDKPQRQRIIDVIRKLYYASKGILKVVSGLNVQSESELVQQSAKIVDAGYEGAILRVGDCKYRNGYRSRQLIKYKNFDDAEFKIVGAEENTGRQKGQCCFICETNEGHRFKVKPEGTDEERREYWTNRNHYMGQWLKVRYFGMTTSEASVPRFPVGIGIRPDWDM